MIIDTHIHLFAADLDSFPYHPEGSYQPSTPSTLEDYVPAMDEAGIAGAVLVHAEPYLDDHRYTLHCLQNEPRLKATCLYAPHDSEGPEKMKALVELAGPGQIVAFRIHAYREGGIPDLNSPSLRALWGAAVDLGLAVQLHFVPKYAIAFAELIRNFPGSTVIIDHLGRPGQGTAVEYEGVLALAEFDRTFLKLSAVASASSEPWPHRDVAPLVKRLVDRFGSSRVIYGGGYSPGTTGEDYTKGYRLVSELLGHLPATDKELILGKNAKELFGFEV